MTKKHKQNRELLYRFFNLYQNNRQRIGYFSLIKYFGLIDVTLTVAYRSTWYEMPIFNDICEIFEKSSIFYKLPSCLKMSHKLTKTS